MNNKNQIDPLATSYETWRIDRSPVNMGLFLEQSKPVINSFLNTLGNKSPVMRSTAKTLLAKSLERYDPARGVPIKNWMYTQLQPLKRKNVAESSILPVPERARQQLSNLKSKQRELTSELGREPTDLELAERLHITLSKIRRIRSRDIGVVQETMFTDEEGAPELPGTIKVDPSELYADYVYNSLDPIDQKIFAQLLKRPKFKIYFLVNRWLLGLLF